MSERGLREHIEESHPELLDQAEQLREERDKAEFLEVSGFGQSSNLYDLFVPPDDRKLVRSPREAKELTADDTPVDVVVHMGCHVAKTPHIIDATMDVFETLGYTTVPLGGFNNCCGSQHLFKFGDIEGAQQVDDTRFENIAAFDPEYAITECTSCYAKTDELSMGYRSPDFELASMTEFLADRTDDLKEYIAVDDPVTVALHDHYDPLGWTPIEQAEAARELFATLPGVEVVEMEHSLEEGLPCNFRTDPSELGYEDLSRRVYQEAIDAGADVLINFWHACHRHLVSYDREFPITTKNYTEFIAERLGGSYEDKMKIYKTLGYEGDIDAILEDARPTFQANGLSEEEARDLVEACFTDPP